MSLLEVRNLSFAYENNKPVFEDVSFTVERGQVFCLIGPNGCGKTTLEHCILAHLKAQHGDILVDGASVVALSQRELAAQVAYVPQTHTRVFPYRTIDVVAMGRTRHQKFLEPSAGNLDFARDIMEKLGIEHLADVEYTTLSGGELQMVLLARALVQESKILVLDEPTAHLDVRRAQDILLLLASLAKDAGKTIVLSSHDFNQPLMLEDEGADVRMALMENGCLSDVSTPLELLSSDCLNRTYGIESQIVELPTNPVRHYLAVWNEKPRSECDET